LKFETFPNGVKMIDSDQFYDRNIYSIFVR